MVESNGSMALQGDGNEESSQAGHISREAAQENLAFLETQADSWLAALFNVFGTADLEDRGRIGDVISAWANIAKPEVGSIIYPLLVCSHSAAPLKSV